MDVSLRKVEDNILYKSMVSARRSIKELTGAPKYPLVPCPLHGEVPSGEEAFQDWKVGRLSICRIVTRIREEIGKIGELLEAFVY